MHGRSVSNLDALRSSDYRSRCVRRLAYLTISFCLLTFSFASAYSPRISIETREGRLAVFDDVWQTVNDRYYDSRFHGVDWLVQRAALRPQAASAHSPQELYALLRQMLASLRDAHTRVYAPEEKFDWEHPRFVTIGVSLREIEGQPTVVSVDSGSQAERAGMRAGDVIEQVDSESAIALIDRNLNNQVGSSTPQAARSRVFGSLLDGPPQSIIKVVWRSRDNDMKSASFRREWQQRDYILKSHEDRGRVAIVEIPAFTRAMTRDFSHLASKLLHAHGIVFDLRKNGGGDAEAMAEIVSFFLARGTKLGTFTNRSGHIGLALEAESPPLLTTDRAARINAPIVILTSERTSSAAEIFAAALRQSAQATVIGAQTCGCVLAVRTRHLLPDGGELDVSELDYQTADGKRLEGEGLAPDENVKLTRRDLYSNRDPVLESAIAKLRKL